MERWRILVAIIVAGASLPFLLRDDASSADAESTTRVDVLGAVETTTSAPPAPTTSLLPVAQPAIAIDPTEAAQRASQWYEAQRELSESNRELALELVAEEEERVAQFLEQVAAQVPATTVAPPTTAKPAATTAPVVETTAAAVTTTTTPPPTTTASPDTPGSLHPPVADVTAEQWAQLRACESSGNYSVTSPSGKFRGAYQFSVATWDWVAGVHHPWLVGVDPINASAAEQDAQAYALYAMRGAGQWPECGRFL